MCAIGTLSVPNLSNQSWTFSISASLFILLILKIDVMIVE